MKKGAFRHPYLYSSILFLSILGLGLFLRWPHTYNAFLLLLYFIVIIGIKLDDISGQISETRQHLPALMADAETIISQLKDIHAALSSADSIDGSVSGNPPGNQ